MLMIWGRKPPFPCRGPKPGREFGKCRADGWLCMEALPVGIRVRVVRVVSAERTLSGSLSTLEEISIVWGGVEHVGLCSA